MNKKIIMIALAALSTLSACKKGADLRGSLASVRVVHAAVDAGTIKVNYLGRSVNWLTYIGTDGSMAYGLNKVYSVTDASAAYPFIVVPSQDTLKAVFNGTLSLEPKGSYSLYLSGVAPAYDTVFVKEDLPVYADSVLGVRFMV